MKSGKLVYIMAFSSVIFTFVAINVFTEKTGNFDDCIYKSISLYIKPMVTDIMILLSFFGSAMFFTAFGVISFAASWRKSQYTFYISMILINLCLCGIINTGVKQLFHRDRPNIMRLVEISGFSFPSGHSMVSISFYGFMIYLIYKYCKTKWRYFGIAILSILILFIGVSRIYLGVHYASDVIGGFALGSLWLSIFIFIIELERGQRV
jgi:undecaprenyl-diphosphatase